MLFQKNKITGGAALLAAVSMLCLPLLATVQAASPSLSHAYETSQPIAAGSLVSLNGSNSNIVVPANTENSEGLVGIIVDDSDSLIAVDEAASTVQVATSGIVRAAVSSVNGAIDPGDLISVSSFNGIGKKAEPGERVVGLAQTELSSSTPGVSEQDVTSTSGEERTIAVGYVELSVAVGSAPVEESPGDKSALAQFAYELTGKEVSATRLIVSGIVVLVTLAALITLISTSIYATTVAIGRNPLAAKAIYRTLALILLMAVLVAMVATMAVLAILGV